MIPTNSVSAPSTLSIPASTEMTSELGCANFLDSTLEKNTLSVYPTPVTRQPNTQDSQRGTRDNEPRVRARPIHGAPP